MAELLFGTAGVPFSAKQPSTVGGIERVAELGLGCMEIEWVQRVSIGEKAAALVAEAAGKTGVKLTVHAPYYINLNAREPEKVSASQTRILKAARAGKLCGASSVAFHAAFNMGDPPESVYEVVRRGVSEIRQELAAEGNNLWIRPELMGRATQFGDLPELLELAGEIDGVAPCLDFAHWHARGGANNSYEEFSAALSLVEERLGRAALEDLHIHLAGIDYGAKGERKHLNLDESDMHYVELLTALRDHRAAGVVICESPNREEDALLLRDTYHRLLEEASS
jgi:deoxyribonuclease-4